MSIHNQTTDIIEGNLTYVYKALNAELFCSRHIKIYYLIIVKLRQGSGKERQGKARMAKGERP